MPGDLPRLPARPSARRAGEKNAATYLALVGLSILAFAFLSMASLVLPQIRGLILVLLGGVAFFAIHYLVWGRLLSRMHQEEQEAERGRADSLRAGNPRSEH